MPKPRLTPPVITIGRVKRRMTGNSTDGYRVRIDNLFTAHVKCSPLSCGTVAIVRCSNLDVFCREIKGYREQAAANAVGKWFEARANGWGAPVVDRKYGS